MAAVEPISGIQNVKDGRSMPNTAAGSSILDRLPDVSDSIKAAPVPELIRKTVKRTYDMFVGNVGLRPKEIPLSTEARLKSKMDAEFAFLPNMQPKVAENAKSGAKVSAGPKKSKGAGTTLQKMIEDISTATEEAGAIQALQVYSPDVQAPAQAGQTRIVQLRPTATTSSVLQDLVIRRAPNFAKATWHPPWKLMRVISGHQGWVRCLAVDPGNEWFVSGGADRLIKIWDMATGTLKVSLTGHVNTVRGLVVSPRHPYLFSCGEDHMVKCWDLEYNKVIRDYHGHLSGVYCMTLHPTLDVLATGGRDAVVRVWDVRTKQAIHVMTGHTGTVMSLVSQNNEPQLISGSMDKMVRCWDLAAGTTSVALTNHKKSIRGLALHPREYTFCSAGADSIKVWKCPEGRFERNIDPANCIVNCVALKDDPDSSVLVAGADQGYLFFWDWKSGYKFQTLESRPQPGSMASENGIFDVTFDRSETRLITAECDKTIKMWKEDDTATMETHPLDPRWRPKGLSRF